MQTLYGGEGGTSGEGREKRLGRSDEKGRDGEENFKAPVTLSHFDTHTHFGRF